jgi:hypothetical protein
LLTLAAACLALTGGCYGIAFLTPASHGLIARNSLFAWGA